MEWVVGLSTVALVAVTLWYATQTQQMVREMRRAREAQLQPSVELRIEHERWNPSVLALVISNTGGGPARDVRFEFDQPVPYRLGSEGERLHLSDLRVFHGIPMLSPNQTIVLYFDLFANYWNNADAPKKFSYTVTFDDSFGQHHAKTDLVDVGLLYQTAPVWDHPLKSMAKDINDISRRMNSDLRDIASALRKPHRVPVNQRLRRWWANIRAGNA